MQHALAQSSTALIVASLFAAWSAGCTSPVAKSYQIHTGEIECEQASRLVHETMIDNGMTITGFELAKPGSPGYVRGTRTESRGTTKGEATIRCDPDGVHITTDSSGVGANQHEFERGIFLGVTGRADLTVEREGRHDTGVLKKREPAAPGAIAGGAQSGSAARRSEEAVGVVVRLQPIHGFATVLDFEADLSAAGILPVKVTITNGTSRAYEFDPADIALREAGSRRRAYPMTPSKAVDRLQRFNRGVIDGGAAQPSSEVGPVDASASSEIGDVRAASRIIPARKLGAARLRPSESVSGFLYYEVGNYDRARITMIDAATGETEGFIVEF